MAVSGSGGAAEPFDRLDALSPPALERWWTRRVRAVLEIAATELPFYRERFATAGYAPSQFRRLADLAAVPIVNKADLLQAQRDGGSHAIGIERRGTGRRHNTLSLSSGTSGTTFITHTDRWRRLQGRSAARAHWWAGLRPGTPFVLSAPAWHSYAAVQPFIAEYFQMPCMVVSGTYLPRFADRIVDAFRHSRPRFVTMFLPMVFSIIAAGRRAGLGPEEVFAGVETLVVTGAPITPGMRDHLLHTTGVHRVAEIAGTSENVLAVDCAYARGLHVVPDTCYVEVLDRQTRQPVPDGQRGSIVHCYLVAAGSMYIRYDSEDAAVMDSTPCACGLPSPRIKVMGRWENSFRLAGETLLPYDVQLALEQAVPELIGTPFVIVKEALMAGRLRLLLPEPERRAARLADGVSGALRRRFAVATDVSWVSELPLQFKGVAPVLSESQAAEVR
jgi:phenylacetate-CoA ligase